jgi:hypothetical protein
MWSTHRLNLLSAMMQHTNTQGPPPTPRYTRGRHKLGKIGKIGNPDATKSTTGLGQGADSKNQEARPQLLQQLQACHTMQQQQQHYTGTITGTLYRDSTVTTPAGVAYRKRYEGHTGTTPTGVCRCDLPVYTPSPNFETQQQKQQQQQQQHQRADQTPRHFCISASCTPG